MKSQPRNIVIAVVLLAVLLVLPFWPKIRQAPGPGGRGGSLLHGDGGLPGGGLPELRAAGVALEADGTLFSTPVR